MIENDDEATYRPEMFPSQWLTARYMRIITWNCMP